MRARSSWRRTSRSRFASLERQREIGELKLKISGCINACGHHHVGHIGILGVEKKGAELYQVTLGGSGDEHTSIGEIIGRGFGPDEITDAIETIVETYLGLRRDRRRNIPRRLSPGRRSAVQGGALWCRIQSCLTAGAERSAQADALEARYGDLSPQEIIASARSRAFRRRDRRGVVVRRRFGRAAAHDRARSTASLPVLFLDTGKHFGETLEYRDALAADLGLSNVQRDHAAARRRSTRDDPDGTLHQRDTDACCGIRKVEPMARAVEPFGAWLTGRKRFQAATRGALPVFEAVGPRIRINPLARWTTSDLADYMRAHRSAREPAGRLWLSVDRLLPVHAAGASPARMRAAAAGPAKPRPNAAFICRSSSARWPAHALGSFCQRRNTPQIDDAASPLPAGRGGLPSADEVRDG